MTQNLQSTLAGDKRTTLSSVYSDIALPVSPREAITYQVGSPRIAAFKLSCAFGRGVPNTFRKCLFSAGRTLAPLWLITAYASQQLKLLRYCSFVGI